MKDKIKQFLLWSQKYTKTDMLYITRASSWLSLGRGINLGGSLLLTVAFANLLPKDVFGTYQFVMTVSAVLGSFTLSKIGTAISRSTAKGVEGALRYGFRTQLKWSIAITVIGGGMGVYYFINDNNTLALSFLIVGAFSPFLIGYRLSNSYLIGKQLFKESAMLGLWRKPIPVISLLIGVWLTRDPVILVLIYFLSSTVSAGLLYTLVVRKYHLPVTKDKQLTDYSKHLSLLGIISMVSTNLDKLLLFHFLGATTLAIYALAFLPIRHLISLFGLLRQATLPKLSQRRFSILQGSLPYKVRAALVLVCGLVMIYIFAAPLIFTLLFPSYPEAIPITQALSLLVLSAPRGFYTQAFMAHKMKKQLYLSHLSLPILNVVLLPPFIIFYGMWGAVTALLTSHLLSSLFIRFLFKSAKL